MQQSHEEDSEVAASSTEKEPAHAPKSMWQRLRSMGRQQKRVSKFGDTPCLCEMLYLNCIVRCCTVLAQMQSLLPWTVLLGTGCGFGLLSERRVLCRRMPQRTGIQKMQRRGS